MDYTLKFEILELLDQHRLMTVATNGPDGWPQATTVGYVNDGLTIYFPCRPQSPKAANLAQDNRISLTIDHDVADPMAITSLSMAA
jgi:nitroimidazol reductase NimA-like FMN-containing flavoprotein (pyridoxamine 5'-phosphate oxidase superfamily)